MVTCEVRTVNIHKMDTETEHFPELHPLSPSGVLPDPCPMVVWLRGDESYCDEFSLDADAVMERLGIRRTRLTQISGRELRVGRTRRGRYVVPVYRPVDVTEYQQWTRATATHVKSSHLVQEAADSLRQAGEDLADRVDDTARRLTSSLEQSVRQGALNASALTLPLLHALDQQLGPLASQVSFLAGQEQLTRKTLEQKLRHLTTESDLLKAMLTLVGRDLLEVTGLARLALDEGRTQSDALSAALARVEHSVTQEEPLPQPRRAISKVHTRRLTMSSEVVTQPRPGPVRRVRPRP